MKILFNSIVNQPVKPAELKSKASANIHSAADSLKISFKGSSMEIFTFDNFDIKKYIIENFLIKDMSEKDFTDATVKNCKLEGNMKAVKFFHTSIFKLKCQDNTDLTNANFSATQIVDSKFSGTLSDADFSGADIWKTSFENCTAKNTKFNYLDWNKNNCRFYQLEFTDSDFSNAEFNCANFERVTMKKTDFKEAKFNNAIINYMDAQDISFSKADFSGADIDSEIPYSDFSSSDFTEAKFNNATINHLTAVNANFTRADFTGATLNNVEAKDANFTGADFTGAKVNNLDLRNANLTNAIGLDKITRIEGGMVAVSNKTIMPDGKPATKQWADAHNFTFIQV